MTAPHIKTTLVGSYPVPAWLAAHPSELALKDATAVVIHLQELAGIDLVVDGELYRFDPDHPETNGMIEYFVAHARNPFRHPPRGHRTVPLAVASRLSAAPRRSGRRTCR